MRKILSALITTFIICPTWLYLVYSVLVATGVGANAWFGVYAAATGIISLLGLIGAVVEEAN